MIRLATMQVEISGGDYVVCDREGTALQTGNIHRRYPPQPPRKTLQQQMDEIDRMVATSANDMAGLVEAARVLGTEPATGEPGEGRRDGR